MAGSDIGTLVDGRFRIIDKLGEGGMSIVWLARDERLEKLWAIKEVKLNSNDGLYRANIAATRQEANIMKRLDHPALPRIVDVVDDKGKSLLVVMDYVPGKDLLKRLKERGAAFLEKDVIDWGIQLCDALSYLHAQDPPIIYRDMKPGNVVLQDDGSVKIIDFGIAREYKEGQTLDTTPLGTRGYAPPEAFVAGRKAQTDPRSDIYTLGVTLFHLVTGHSPMEYVTQPNLPPIRSINPALSPGLESIIIKATDWNPENRQQSCDELRYELENPPDPEEYRWMRKQISMFRAFVIAGSVSLVLGIGSLVGSNMIKGSSYDGLIARASTADVNEDEEGGASEAERLYTEAIGITANDLTPYSALLNDVYKSDSKFTTSEASRWNTLFDNNRQSIEGLDYYDRLCYDAGIDYFLYYDYGDALVRGSQAVNWFERAIAAYDAAPESTHRADDENAMTSEDRDSAEVYITIGEFQQRISNAVAEGRESQTYTEYFTSLESAVLKAKDSATVAQLRLYDVVFSALSSNTYLSGFSRAGITETRVLSLLDTVKRQTDAIKEAAYGSELTQEIYDKIIESYEKALMNIDGVYHSAGARGVAMAGGSSTGTRKGSSAGTNDSTGASTNAQGGD